MSKIESSASFQVMDDAALATLPRKVVIRGNNATFLRAWDCDGKYLLKFDSQPESTAARFEIHPALFGLVRIRSSYFGSYWRCTAKSDNYVHCNGDHIPKDGLFQLVRVQVGPLVSYAIKSMQLDLYLTRTDGNEDIADVMRATSESIVPSALFQVYDANNFNPSTTEEAAQQEKEAQAN